MISFFFIALLLALSPGPDNMYIITQSMQRGKAAGFVLTAGLCSGLVIHTLGAAFGISALFLASPGALLALKVFGASYLLYLAYLLAGAKPRNMSQKTSLRPLGKLYLQGVVMNLSNPKVLLFFLAFLPQFIDPAQSVILQGITYGLLFIAATAVVFASLAYFADFMAAFLRSKRFFKILNLSTAAIFVTLAVLLFF